MAKFKWKDGGPKHKISADVFEAEADRLRRKLGRDPLPPHIVEAAKDPRSPLHPDFNWDIQRAAEMHWRDHARRMLNGTERIVVTSRELPTVSTRAFFPVRSADGTRGYAKHSRIIGDASLKIQVMMTSRRELESFVKKFQSVLSTYGTGRALNLINEAIDQIRDDIDHVEMMAKKRRPARQSAYDDSEADVGASS